MFKKALFFLIAGIGMGLVISSFFPKRTITNIFQPDSVRAGATKFTNPLLDCEQADIGLQTELSPFRKDLESYITKNIDSRLVTHISLYFRDLNNGLWIGINEKDPFVPASLLKVPVLMTIYKMAETDPAILAMKFKFDKTNNSEDQFIKPTENLVPGQEYTVDDLVRRMIIYSDNDAVILLNKLLANNQLDDTNKGIDIPIIDYTDPNAEVRIKDYAGFFRILYNASYLNKEMSEKALDLLSQSAYRDGLVAGVSNNIPVAHKFGERGLPEKNEVQLHDCGIVYYPNKPYLICIMTRGKNYEVLQNAIRDLSRLVYLQVDKQLTNTIVP